MASAAAKDTNKKAGAQVPATTQAGSVPAFMKDRLKEDAGKGVSENQDDSLVPMIVVLQAQSPQAIKGRAEYIKDAGAGAIWLKNAPHPIIPHESNGLLVQPCSFYKTVVEWIPKNKDGSGGGFVATHDAVTNFRHPGDQMPVDAKKVEDPDGGADKWMSPRDTEYVDTRNHAVIAYTVDGPFPYLIPLSSTGHSVSRQWMFMMKSKNVEGTRPPSYACLYRLRTVLRTKGNNSWYTLDPKEGTEDGVLWATEAQYEAGRALNVAFEKGEKKADTSDMSGVVGGEAPPKDNGEAGKHI